jgi:nucleoside-specific outer membrane channel protein Tsx
MQTNMFGKAALAVTLAAASVAASAADWSDTYIGYRYGTKFREPFNRDDIKKDIYSLTHASGYKYGSNFFNVDMLNSNNKDPAGNNGQGASNSGATEVFVVYRHNLSLSKVSGKDLKFGIVRDVAFTAGFDYNSKNDAFGAKVRRPMIGPTIDWAVPVGFASTGILYRKEWNHNGFSRQDGSFKGAWSLNTAWGIPFSAGLPMVFKGFWNYTAAKGPDLGAPAAQTKPETLIELALMADVGSVVGKKDVFYAGLGYQYWKNKFGSDSGLDATGGSTAKVPQLLLEAHF